MWWQALVGAIAALLVLWLALVVMLWRECRHGPEAATLRGALRLIPDVIRLLRRLAADPDLPKGVRIRIWLLLGYLASPIDIVPDFIPVIGYVDDVVIVVLAVRAIARAAGPEALRRHWPGTDQGLVTLLTLAGV